MERIARRRRRVGVLSLGSNPLRRGVDRMEAGIFAALLVAFLIGAPLLAVAAGWWEHGAAAAEQRAQRSVTWLPRSYCRTSLTSWPAPAHGTPGLWPGGQHLTASPVSAWSWTSEVLGRAAGCGSGWMRRVGRPTRRSRAAACSHV
jgi:hypothetical protein